MLTGKKTYIIATLMAIAAFAKVMGWVDDSFYTSAIELLAPLGLGTMAAKVNKVNRL